VWRCISECLYLDLPLLWRRDLRPETSAIRHVTDSACSTARLSPLLMVLPPGTVFQTLSATQAPHEAAFRRLLKTFPFANYLRHSFTSSNNSILGLPGLFGPLITPNTTVFISLLFILLHTCLIAEVQSLFLPFIVVECILCLCSRLTALWCYINCVLLLSLLLFVFLITATQARS